MVKINPIKEHYKLNYHKKEQYKNKLNKKLPENP